jgi:hypothetical protein
VTSPDPGSVLRRSLLAWGLGHLAIGRSGLGWGLLGAEVVAILLVAWLTIGLADSSAYLVPYLAGAAFIVAWAWQAIDAYRSARRLEAASPSTPERSPAAVIGWLSLPLLVWGAGFWLVGAQGATPAAILDRFVTAWIADELDAGWPPELRREADAAAAALGSGPDRFRDVRIGIVAQADGRATAVVEAIHYERRAIRILGLFAGSELVPVSDERILTLELEAHPVELLGGGDIGAVRWDLVGAER